MSNLEKFKSWTGLFSYINAEGKIEPGKTLWDWMNLFLVPILIGGGLTVYNQVNHENELMLADRQAQIDRNIANENGQEAALQSYLDRIDTLLVDDNLGQQDAKNGAAAIAETLTRTILRRIDVERKSTVLHFLGDANALAFMDLPNLNLSHIDLMGANLNNADLINANLTSANLANANMNGCNLSGTNLINADLTGAKMDKSTTFDNDTTLPDGTKWSQGADLTKFHVIMIS